jgi:hypothetical protein
VGVTGDPESIKSCSLNRTYIWVTTSDPGGHEVQSTCDDTSCFSARNTKSAYIVYAPQTSEQSTEEQSQWLGELVLTIYLRFVREMTPVGD